MEAFSKLCNVHILSVPDSTNGTELVDKISAVFNSLVSFDPLKFFFQKLVLLPMPFISSLNACGMGATVTGKFRSVSNKEFIMFLVKE